MTFISPVSTLASLLTSLIHLSSHLFPASGRPHVTGLANGLWAEETSHFPAKPATWLSSCLFSCCSYLKKSSCWYAGPKTRASQLLSHSVKDSCPESEPKLTSGFMWLSNKLLCVQSLEFGSYLLLRQKPSLSWPIVTHLALKHYLCL